MKKILKPVFLVLIALAVVWTFVFLYRKSNPAKEMPRIEQVKAGDNIETKTVITGIIQPRDEVMIKPQMSGIVAELLHKPGETVQAGEVIARLSVVPDMIQLNSAESRVKVAEISYAKAEEVYRRDLELHKKGVVPTEEFQASKAACEQANQELIAARDAFDITRTGVSRRMAKQSSTLVRSTISGKILDIPVKVGNSVIQANTFNEGTTIASVADMNDLLFVGKVDETEIGKMRIGMPVGVNVGAIGSEKFPAVIEYISPKGMTLNDATFFEIKAAVKIPQKNEIRSGYGANGEIVLQSAKNILTIPEGCVTTQGDSAFVQVVTARKPEIKSERRAVKLGISDGIKVQVLSGLKGGEYIVGAVSEQK